jgi:hypothetical protein
MPPVHSNLEVVPSVTKAEVIATMEPPPDPSAPPPLAPSLYLSSSVPRPAQPCTWPFCMAPSKTQTPSLLSAPCCARGSLRRW